MSRHPHSSLARDDSTPCARSFTRSARSDTPPPPAYPPLSTDPSALSPTSAPAAAAHSIDPSADSAVFPTGAAASIGTDDAAAGGLEEGGSSAPADPNASLTVRALVSTKEAGVIIGKAGHNVAELREKTGVKAGVSKVVQGVHDRVLSVSGNLEGVAKVSAVLEETGATKWKLRAN